MLHNPTCVTCRFLGLTVGAIQSNISIDAAKAAYSCHVTYVTGQELCFNYLKDNTAQTAAELVRPLVEHSSTVLLLLPVPDAVLFAP